MSTAYEMLQAEALRGLTEVLPLNDFGLPVGIYRTDLLPFDDYDPHARAPRLVAPEVKARPRYVEQGPTDAELELLEHEMEELVSDVDEEGNVVKDATQNKGMVHIKEEEASLGATSTQEDLEPYVKRKAGFPINALDNAFVPLNYDEGYPALSGGTPFWSKLDFEPADAFAIFQRFLQMPAGTCADEDGLGATSASGERSVSALTEVMHDRDGELLGYMEQYKMYSHLYYWGLRAKSYDFYRVAAHRKQQELRAIESQDEHYFDARGLRNKLMHWIGENEEDFWDMLTPKTAMDMMDKLIKIERISVGLGAAGPSGSGKGEGNLGGQTLEVMVQQVAKSSHTKGVIIDNATEELIEDAMLDDEDMLENMQALIVRIQSNGG